MWATFAINQGYGREEWLDWWVLQDDESWHDAVRGDGCSYRPGGPPDMEKPAWQSEERFRQLVGETGRAWAQENLE